MKLSDWRIEYTVTIMVVFAAILMVIPTSIKSTVQANHITKWKDNYKQLEYAQEAILTHGQTKILPGFNNSKTLHEREDIFITLLKPYYRVSDKKVPSRYDVKFMNNTKIPQDSEYYVEDYFFTKSSVIVGIKDLPDNEDEEPKFLMTFDVNGLVPPNKWGRDVFGVMVYPDKIEALGKDLTIAQQKEICTPDNIGVTCSNYYLIGGDFDD